MVVSEDEVHKTSVHSRGLPRVGDPGLHFKHNLVLFIRPVGLVLVLSMTARLVNIAIVVFSASQETYTIATATSANTVAGSLGGTVIALGLCLGVVLNLPETPIACETGFLHR